MKTIYKSVSLFVMAMLFSLVALGQYSPDYTGGLKISLNEDGSKYVRFLTWHQMWATFEGDQVDFRLRRSRFLAFAKINSRFLILTHFGVNNLSAGQMGTAGPVPSGSGNGRFFMHDAWADITLIKGILNVGGGLHYWNGISRLNNQSTINFLTLDAPGHNWANLGTSDQFARHLGFFAKGKLGRLDYRFALNEAIKNPLLGGSLNTIQIGTGDTATFVPNQAVYRNEANPGGGKIVSGYVKYDFFDKESNTLPYFVGSYMGKKKILNVGAGFFYHADGASYYKSSDSGTAPTLVSPTSFAVDAFADLPLAGKTMGFTGYASFTRHDWGPNLVGGIDGVGSGNIAYVQAGLALKEVKNVGQFQPYVHFTNRNLEAHSDFSKRNSTRLGVGANWYIEGHNLKVSAEFQTSTETGQSSTPDASNLFRIQLHAFL